MDTTFGLCTCGVSDGKCPPGTGCTPASRRAAARPPIHEIEMTREQADALERGLSDFTTEQLDALSLAQRTVHHDDVQNSGRD
jgi:hypothetical protein